MKIYLAVPYTACSTGDELRDLNLMKERFHSAAEKTGELLSRGHIVLCPVVHYHPVAEVCDLPRDWAFWRNIDEALVEWCDELWVYMLDGWDESTGIRAEVEKAERMNIPVRYCR